MSGHRIELHVRFTVGDGTDGGRAAAEEVLRQFEYLADHGQLDDYADDVQVLPSAVDGIGWYEKWPPVAVPETPFDRLVRLTEAHLRLLIAESYSAPLVDRLRREKCLHDWSYSAPLKGFDDAIDCLKCGLRVHDGYRPHYTGKAP